MSGTDDNYSTWTPLSLEVGMQREREVVDNAHHQHQHQLIRKTSVINVFNGNADEMDRRRAHLHQVADFNGQFN